MNFPRCVFGKDILLSGVWRREQGETIISMERTAWDLDILITQQGYMSHISSSGIENTKSLLHPALHEISCTEAPTKFSLTHQRIPNEKRSPVIAGKRRSKVQQPRLNCIEKAKVCVAGRNNVDRNMFSNDRKISEIRQEEGTTAVESYASLVNTKMTIALFWLELCNRNSHKNALQRVKT